MVLDAVVSMPRSTCHSCGGRNCRLNDRVLIVDDEPGILFAYRRLLEQEGLTVDSCDCLCEALDYLDRHRYLAVVADMRLEGSDSADGLALLRKVRQQQPAAQIIIASGNSDEQVRGETAGLGVEHYLEKPVNPIRIVELLNRLRQAAASDPLEPVPDNG